MKRYLVFGGEDYYANGGWADFIGDAPTPEDALMIMLARKLKAKDHKLGLPLIEWWHVVDTETQTILEEG